MKFLKWIKDRMSRNGLSWENNPDISERQELLKEVKILKSLEQNIEHIEKITGPSPDLIIRRFKIAGRVESAFIYIVGLADEKAIEAILHTLMAGSFRERELRRSPLPSCWPRGDLCGPGGIRRGLTEK